jgi:hypothetical protein
MVARPGLVGMIRTSNGLLRLLSNHALSASSVTLLLRLIADYRFSKPAIMLFRRQGGKPPTKNAKADRAGNAGSMSGAPYLPR